MSNDPFSNAGSNSHRQAETAFTDTSTAEAISRKIGTNSGYQVGYDAGEAAGVLQGHAQGVTEGVALGTTAGEVAGLATGIAQGTAQGLVDGHAQGLSDGYAQGFTDGYNQSSSDAGTGFQAPTTATMAQCQPSNECYDLGYATGDTDGQTIGFADGVVSVYMPRYDEGFTAGRAEGYLAGVTAGMEQGKAEGLTEGMIKGYSDGYEACMQALEADGYETMPKLYDVATLPNTLLYKKHIQPTNSPNYLHRGDLVLSASKNVVYKLIDPIPFEIPEGLNLGNTSFRHDGHATFAPYNRFEHTGIASQARRGHIKFPFDPTTAGTRNRSAISQAFTDISDGIDIHWLVKDDGLMDFDTVEGYVSQLGKVNIRMVNIYQAGDGLDTLSAVNIVQRMQANRSANPSVQQMLIYGLDYIDYNEVYEGELTALLSALKVLSSGIHLFVLLGLMNTTSTIKAKVKKIYKAETALSQVQYADLNYVNVKHFSHWFTTEDLPLRVNSFIINELVTDNLLSGIEIGRGKYGSICELARASQSTNLLGNAYLTHYPPLNRDMHDLVLTVNPNSKRAGSTNALSSYGDFTISGTVGLSVTELYLNLGKDANVSQLSVLNGTGHHLLLLTASQQCGVTPVTLPNGTYSFLLGLTDVSDLSASGQVAKRNKLTSGDFYVSKARRVFEEAKPADVNNNVPIFTQAPDEYWTRYMDVTPNLWIKYSGKFKPYVMDGDNLEITVYEEGDSYFFKAPTGRVALRVASTAQEIANLVLTEADKPEMVYSTTERVNSNVFQNFTPKFIY